jgi:uncharacterized membrane protein YheB (UPF0754 family)
VTFASISKIVQTLLEAVTRNDGFYNDVLLKKDLSNLFSTRLEDEWEPLRISIISTFKKFFLELNKTLVVETKDAICKTYIIDAVFNTLERNLEAVIHAIDVKTVIEREINDMHPQKIERLFKKIAGRYFRKIKLYGGIGGVGGVIACSISYVLGFFIK